MKKFVISMGNGLIDLCAWFLLLAIIISSIITMFNNFAVGFGVLTTGLTIFVILFYFLYILMSINDNLTEINQKLNNNTPNIDLSDISENSIQEEELKPENTGLNGKVYIDAPTYSKVIHSEQSSKIKMFFIISVIFIITIFIAIFIAAL